MIVNPKLKGYDFTALNAKLAEEEYAGGTITSIYDYYANLSKIRAALDLKDYGYLYASLKEPYFEIDANSRAIKVPDVFKANGIGIKGDNLAETICFSVDRYFDTMDLLKTNVYVNWSLNNGAKEGKEQAFFVDPIAKADYLIIGWPLDGEKFTDKGTLKFYISFEIVENDVTKYRLNTLTADVKINSTLDFTAEPEAIPDTNYDTTYGILFTGDTEYSSTAELGVLPVATLACDLQKVTNGQVEKSVAGMRKEIIGTEGLELGAKFDFANDTNLTVKFYKGTVGTEIQAVDGIYKNAVTEPGVYQIKATPTRGTGATAQTGVEIQTSQIVVMPALQPIYELEYTNHLPQGVKEKENANLVYAPAANASSARGSLADAKLVITGLNYATDFSGMPKSAADFGQFKLVIGIPDTDPESEVPVEIEHEYAFDGKTLIFTREIFDYLTTTGATAKITHTLNGNTLEVANALGAYHFVTTVVEPLIFTTDMVQGTLTLGKQANFFTLTKSFALAGVSAVWQHASVSTNGRTTWADETYLDGDTIVAQIGLDATKVYTEKNKTQLIDAVQHNYRIKLVKADDYTYTTSLDSPSGYDMFYTVNVQSVLTTEPTD